MRRLSDASRLTSRVLATTTTTRGCDAFEPACFRFRSDESFARARTQTFASTSFTSASAPVARKDSKDSTAPVHESPATGRPRTPPPPPKRIHPEINLDDPSRPRRPRPRARVDVADVFKAKASAGLTASENRAPPPDADAREEEEEDRARRRRAFHAARGMDVPEHGGPSGLEPTRYGDWERAGRVSDF